MQPASIQTKSPRSRAVSRRLGDEIIIAGARRDREKDIADAGLQQVVAHHLVDLALGHAFASCREGLLVGPRSQPARFAHTGDLQSDLMARNFHNRLPASRKFAAPITSCSRISSL